MPWPTRGYGICPDPEGEARGIRAVIFHNPDVAMAQLFYTIVAATTTLSYPPIMGPALPHITLLPLSYLRNLPQLAALLLTAEQPR